MLHVLAACLLLHNATVIDPASSQVRRGVDVVGGVVYEPGELP